MGFTNRLSELWRSDEIKPILRAYMIKWRSEPSIIRIERPTRLDRAHALGYKAKKGFVIVRVKLTRGGRMRKKFKGGRRSKHMRRRKVVSKGYQVIAEARANKQYKNLAVLNSYILGKDGKHYFYEIIMVDPEIVKSYKGFEWFNERKHRTRVYHGETSAGKRSRGLYRKGKGAEKIRPSLRANLRRSK